MNKIKALITEDECFPFYYLELVEQGEENGGEESWEVKKEISEEFLERYERVMKEFEELQKDLASYFEKAD